MTKSGIVTSHGVSPVICLPTMNRDSSSGLAVTLLSTLCAGLAPIFGKLAYRADVTPYTLVAARTLLAAGLLWLFYLIFWPKLIRINRINLLGCVGMGLANGFGSLLYYTGLSRVDASLAQLLYALYPVWVLIFVSAAGHPVSRLAVLRLIIALGGVFLLTSRARDGFDMLGVMLMISAGAAYAWHLVLGQWTLAKLDSRTMTLYVLTTMALVVTLARLFIGGPLEPISTNGWLAIVGLALIPTALARLFLFAGISRLGGVQASLIGVAELIVAIGFAYVLLGERLTMWQSFGAIIVILSIMLIGRESTIEVEEWEEWLFETDDGSISTRTTPRSDP